MSTVKEKAVWMVLVTEECNRGIHSLITVEKFDETVPGPKKPLFVKEWLVSREKESVCPVYGKIDIWVN